MPTSPESPKFPAWFPPNYPPPEALDADGVMFRFVAKNPVAATDFLSHFELGRAPKAKPCERAGLSVFRNVASARRKLRELRERYPARYSIYTHIASGSLAPAHGKIMQQGGDPDHYNWWAFEGVERHAPFEVVETLES